MAQVTVYYRGIIEEKIEKKEDVVQADAVRDVLQYVKKTYGAAAYREGKRMLITVNNDSIQLHKGFDTKLEDGMEVRFLPICGGG